MNQATGYASQHKSVPVPSQDKLGGLRGRKGIRRNMGGFWGWGHHWFRLEWRPRDCRCLCLHYLPYGALVRMGWRPPGLSVHLPPLSSPARQKSRRWWRAIIFLCLTPWAPPHACVNRRWGNPTWTQHNPMLRQRAEFMMTLPGLINCRRAGPLGLVPGILTHWQGDQVNYTVSQKKQDT